MSEVTVLGIFVADLSFSANKIPTTGETILGDKYNIGPGGKGCNQAIALARLGCNVNFISKIGNDDYGKLALDSLKQNKIEEARKIFESILNLPSTPSSLATRAKNMIDYLNQKREFDKFFN